MTALSDELRVRIFAYLCENTAGPREIAKALGAKLGDVRYRVDQLREGGWIGDDPSFPGRGNHYRAIRSMVISPGAWDRLPEPAKHKIAIHILRHLYADVGASIEAEKFLKPGMHLSLTPMVVDPLGQRDAKSVLEEALKQLVGIQRESDHRRARAQDGNSDGVALTIALFSFESFRDPTHEARASATMCL